MLILLRYLLSNSEVRKSLEDATSLFVDSKRVVQKKYSQEKPAKKNSKSLGYVSKDIIGGWFDAHDALQDVSALAKIITSPKLDLKKHDIVDFAIELPTAFDYLDFLDKRNPFKEKYQSQLKGLSDYMIDKMVEKGITVKVLRTLYRSFGIAGICGYLSRTSRDMTEVRITRSVTSIARIVCSLQQDNNIK